MTEIDREASWRRGELVVKDDLPLKHVTPENVSRHL